MWDGYSAQVVDLYNSPGVQEFWAIRKHQFSPDFDAYLVSQSAAVEARPMYGADE